VKGGDLLRNVPGYMLGEEIKSKRRQLGEKASQTHQRREGRADRFK